MAHLTHHRLLAISAFSLAWLTLTTAGQVSAAQPDAAAALKLRPIQSGIDYDIPAQATIPKCSLKLYKEGKATGWEVRDPDGNVLRRYLDTNADKNVDQWCYFKDGIEVYRDIDSNHNRKADQYRWLGTAGIRWGVDTNEDGHIDRWKAISPEEVSEEVVLALRQRDADRFKLLLLTKDELRDLGLGATHARQLTKQLASANSGFEELLRTQDIVPDDARWVNFGGTRPGVVPAGTDGAKRDLCVYENVAAVIETRDKHGQVIIGTLVQAGDVWRLIDLPKSVTDAQSSTNPEGFFFLVSRSRRTDGNVSVTGGLSPELQRLIGLLEQIDKDLLLADTPETLAPLNAKRADVLELLAAETAGKVERENWLRQLADTVSAAAQSGGYPEGVKRLSTLGAKLEKQKADRDLISYVKYRFLTARYTLSMQQPDADFAKIQDRWLSSLEQFIKDYATSSDASEAMLQLAIAEEFAGNDDGAVKWYGQIATKFPGTTVATKATGAKRRIESIGQSLVLAGQDSHGKTIDVSSYRGKVVLVHYWATYFTQCLPGISLLKDMQAKYGKDNVALIGVNVDSNREDFDAYLKENPLPWPQLYAPGGLDSPLANAYGVLVLPTMILADQEGKVVNRNLDAGEVDKELRRLLR